MSSTSQFKPYRPPFFDETPAAPPSQGLEPEVHSVQNSANRAAFSRFRSDGTQDRDRSVASQPNAFTSSESSEALSALRTAQLEPVSSSTVADPSNDASSESLSCAISVYVPSTAQKKGVIEFSGSSRETSRSVSIEDDDRLEPPAKRSKKGHKKEKRRHKHSKKQKKERVRTKNLVRYTADLKMIQKVLEMGIEAERKKHQETVKEHDLALKTLRTLEDQKLRFQLEKQAYQQALRLSVEFERWRIRRRLELHKQARRNAVLDGTASVAPATTTHKELAATSNGSASAGSDVVKPQTSPFKRPNSSNAKSVAGAEKKRQHLSNDVPLVGLQQQVEDALHEFDDEVKLKYAIFVAENFRDAVTEDEIIQFIQKRDPTVAEKLTQVRLVLP